MKHEFSLENGEVKLIPMTLQLSQQYIEIRNDESNRQWFLSGRVISAADQIKWFERYLLDDTDCMFAIIYNDILVGGNAIYNINNDNKTAEYGRLVIDKKYKGYGLGTTATRIACDIAFSALSLTKLFLEVKEDNRAAIKCYEHALFRKMMSNDGVMMMERSII